MLVESAHFRTTERPLCSTRLESQSYVLSIVSLPGQYAASASAPTNSIAIFDKATLRRVDSLPGHDVATTSLHAVQGIVGGGTTLMSSGRDGSVKIWDPRSRSHSIKMTNSSATRALLCCDVSNDANTIAAGTDMQGDDALIFYWDPRKPAAPLRTHSSTHSDDITTLAFARAPPPPGADAPRNTILSASSDGLVSTSNADEDDEDEAVCHVANWGCSVSQAGWIDTPGAAAGVWAASDMETFSTWSHELDPRQSLDIRSPVLHGRRTWVTDYLITCAPHVPHAPDTLGVFTGSNEGDIALLSSADLGSPTAPWHIHATWTTGHVGVVRALLWDHQVLLLFLVLRRPFMTDARPQNNVLVTGGEDAKLHVWPGLVPADDEMEVDGAAPRKRSLELEELEQEGKRARR
ncbi:hypothetical protein H0H81_011650 [Sphagnurus paluster]|uniref:WD40 repeat-like protein n=1 Tax=Sphagnurus paluster TaxID=117069 RepID=A0A9P7FUG3_9AGAR|nr:hypothetical protein H0H81_011650 [Sphagnurus paluster]